MSAKAQRSFLRRLLVVGRYSMCAPLFTELGLHCCSTVAEWTGELFSLYIHVAVGGPEIDSLKSGSIVKGKWIAA
ncbi:hypothetical protein R3P38DRAFT_3042082 [Favolaschia claudopus]|uniref:Uncharacterized protein n=1 Tax=Favolaschia claudopus TaxID=2862362 RepID=A0AAW0A948_9AGAR